FKVFDRLTQQTVALKQVRTSTRHLQFASVGKAANLKLALAREFRTLSALRHPHIISVFEYGFTDADHPFFTMPFLEDTSQLLDILVDLSLEQQLRYVISLLQALAYLHRHGILHRDLKPANILINDGVLVVLDFGLARNITDEPSDEVTGTLAYIAPE